MSGARTPRQGALSVSSIPITVTSMMPYLTNAVTAGNSIESDNIVAPRNVCYGRASSRGILIVLPISINVTHVMLSLTNAVTARNKIDS